MQDSIKDLAPRILGEIKKANKILVHCHIRPDPDSFASAMATKLVLEDFGKHVVMISGDSPVSTLQELVSDPVDVQPMTFAQAIAEVSPDLFISLDSSSPASISMQDEPHFPQSFPTVNIDHHTDNQRYGEVNLVVTAAATCEILTLLFKEMGMSISKRAADVLYLGLYADSNGFVYPETTETTFQAAEHLKALGADVHAIAHVVNSLPNVILKSVGYALSESQTFFGGQVLLTKIPLAKLQEYGVNHDQMVGINKIMAHHMNLSRESVLIVVIYERTPGKCGLSFRADNPRHMLNVRSLGQAFGGGGHTAAAAGDFDGSLDAAQSIVLQQIAKLYPELGQP